MSKDGLRIKELPEPQFPVWWFDYDDINYGEYTDAVELEGMAFRVHGREPTGRQKARRAIQWHYEEKYVEGYILDGCWFNEYSLPFKRYGWAVAASPNGVDKVPELDGRWLVAGEAQSLKTAFRHAVSTLNEKIEKGGLDAEDQHDKQKHAD